MLIFTNFQVSSPEESNITLCLPKVTNQTKPNWHVSQSESEHKHIPLAQVKYCNVLF
jgi:hypothetical protein